MKNQLIIGIFVIFGLLNLSAKEIISPTKIMENDGSILLPIQKNQKNVKFSTQNTANMPEFYDFTKNHGTWTLLTDKSTQTPFIAYGEPIQITGYSKITKENVESAAMTFIKEYNNLLKVEPANLKFVKATYVENKWIVLYSQYYKDAYVLFSKVQLTISPEAKVFMFHSKYYNNINVSMTPEISYSTAIAKATFGFEASKTKQMNSILESPKMFIIPVINNENVDYKLVYEVNFNTTEQFGKYLSYVDAQNGDVIFRRNLVNSANTKVHVQGSVNMNDPSNDYKTIAFPNKYVTIDGSDYTTDANGDISIDISENKTVNMTLEGKWAKIYRYNTYQSPNSLTTKITDILKPGVDLTIDLTNDNSTKFERNIYSYINRAHAWIKSVDTNLTIMDYQMSAALIDDTSGGWNAFSGGDSITFIGLADSEVRHGEMPGIYSHEYGHSVNKALYVQQGSYYGMVNYTCNEGTADLSAALLLDDPDLAKGYDVTNPEKELRHLVNNIIYPDSIIYEAHYDGQILSGAFWDIRRATTLDYTTHLFHYTRYLIPDDIDNGKSFNEWFVDVLTIDDDDNNLNNGTPNMKIIAQSFNNHHIGTNYWYSQAFTHDSLPDTQDFTNPYIAKFTVADLFSNYGLDSVSIIYTTDNFVTTNRIFAQNLGSGQYTASIPAQSEGTIVKYYMMAYDKISDESLTFSKSNKYNIPYEFNVGYTSYFSEPFEKNNGWSFKALEDSDTKGKWEIAVPRKTDWTSDFFSEAYLALYQLGSDHTLSGTKCLVTGASTDSYDNWYNWYKSYGQMTTTFYTYIPNGRTTATSAKYDISTFTKPLVRFWYWMSNIADPYYMHGDYKAGNFYVEITSDDGANWKRVYANQKSYQDWVMVEFILDDSYKTSQFRIRFIDDAPYAATVVDRTTICELLVDDLELMSLTSASAPTLSVNNVDASILSFRYYPNPVDDNTTISFNLTEPKSVNLKIVNIFGQDVCTLLNSYLDAGTKSIDWKACYTNGTKVLPGMYYIRFQSGSDLFIEKLIVK